MYCNSSVFPNHKDRMVGSGLEAKCCVPGCRQICILFCWCIRRNVNPARAALPGLHVSPSRSRVFSKEIYVLHFHVYQVSSHGRDWMMFSGLISRCKVPFSLQPIVASRIFGPHLRACHLGHGGLAQIQENFGTFKHEFRISQRAQNYQTNR